MQSSISNLVKSTLVGFLLLMFLIQVSIARPQPSIETQDTSDGDSSQDMRRLLSSVNGLTSNSEDPLEQLKYQLFATQYGPNRIGGSINGNGWDTLYRSPEMKRQIRYRQCYFNPISCFKK